MAAAAGPLAWGATFLILGQLLTKLLTFVSNQLLVGSISPEMMGVVAVFEFYVSFALFFCRESERLTIQRATGSSEGVIRQKIVNFAYVPLSISVPLCIGGYYIVKDTNVLNTSFFVPLRSWGILLLVILIMLELAVEPLYALTQYALDFEARSTIESIAVFAKCFVTFACVTWSKSYISDKQRGWAVLSFLLGQLAYALVTVVGYMRRFSFGVSRPAKVTENKKVFLFDPSLTKLYFTLFFQMLFKLVLTEGDKIMMGYLFDVSQQGTYAVISNYGSMIARIVFLPVEEMLRNLFTKVFAAETPSAKTAFTTMENLLAFYMYFSILLLLGGTFNGEFLLRILLGRSAAWRSSELFALFPQYILYLPFMAFNGILEAFQTSILSDRQIKVYSLFMLFLTFISFLVLIVLVKQWGWGLTGLIVANITSMTLRIIYCSFTYVRFARKHSVKTSLATLFRRTASPIGYSVFAYVLQSQLLGSHTTSFQEFFISACICFTCLLVFLMNERRTIEDTFVNKLRRNRGMKVKDE